MSLIEFLSLKSIVSTKNHTKLIKFAKILNLKSNSKQKNN